MVARNTEVLGDVAITERRKKKRPKATGFRSTRYTLLQLEPLLALLKQREAAGGIRVVDLALAADKTRAVAAIMLQQMRADGMAHSRCRTMSDHRWFPGMREGAETSALLDPGLPPYSDARHEAWCEDWAHGRVQRTVPARDAKPLKLATPSARSIFDLACPPDKMRYSDLWGPGSD